MAVRAFWFISRIGALASVLLSLPLSCLAAAASPLAVVQKVTWQDGRLVVRTDRPVEFDHHFLRDPSRLIVDVLGADEPVTGLPAEIPIGVGALRDARIARHPEASLVRIVLDFQGSGDKVVWKADSPGPVRAARTRPGKPAIVRKIAAVKKIAAVRKIAIAPEAETDEDAQASPSIWPAHDQVVDRLRVVREGAETIVDMHALRPLMVWTEQNLLAPRLTLRVPRSSFAGAAPPAVGLIRSLAIVRKDREWDLTVDLQRGLYVCHRTVYDGGRGLAIEIRRRAPLVAGRPVVVIDPGHGGYDPGTTGPGGDLEKDIALDVARRVASALGREGYQVVLTRTMDTYVKLADRRAFMASLGAVAFVSLHCNSSPATTVDGIETYYREPGSQALAQALQRDLVEATRDVDRGTRQAHLVVLEGGSVPSSLVELGFLTDPREERRLRDPGYQEKLARAVARGIRSYLSGRAQALAGRAIAMRPR